MEFFQTFPDAPGSLFWEGVGGGVREVNFLAIRAVRLFRVDFPYLLPQYFRDLLHNMV